MSSKSSYFLTDRNEHAFSDCLEPVEDSSGQWVGDAITLEFSKRNIRIEQNDEQDLIITLNWDSELFRTFKLALDMVSKELNRLNCDAVSVETKGA